MIPQYVGEVAERYERKRQGRKWNAEHRAVTNFLADCQGMTLLDVPCGTGRFHSIYEKFGIDALGVDISPDMRALAEQKGMRTAEGSILAIPAEDKSFDVVLCVRLLNWLSPEDQAFAWKEMRRIARKHIVFGFRGKVEADRQILIDNQGYRIARITNV